MALRPETMRFLQSLATRMACFVIPESDPGLLEGRLMPLASAQGFPDVESMIADVRMGNRALAEDVLDALTNNETSFFRDPSVFRNIEKELIPEMVRRRGYKPLRIWSAACSTGQEAYSLSIVLDKLGPSVQAELLASDISQGALERAMTGRYSQVEINRGLDIITRQKHFAPAPGRDGWEVRRHLRRNITFERINLVMPSSDIPKQDIVLLRNVLIYFTDAHRQQVLRNIRRFMNPDGVLLLGASEMLSKDTPFRAVPRVGAVWYEPAQRLGDSFSTQAGQPA